jgi:hypothetical protein
VVVVVAAVAQVAAERRVLPAQLQLAQALLRQVLLRLQALHPLRAAHSAALQLPLLPQGLRFCRGYTSMFWMARRRIRHPPRLLLRHLVPERLEDSERLRVVAPVVLQRPRRLLPAPW